MTNQRLGVDPLSWIKKTTEEKTEPPKQALNQKIESPRRIIKSSQEGLPKNWTRATFIVREDLLEKLKDLAYTDRKGIKEVVNEALENYLCDKKAIKRG